MPNVDIIQLLKQDGGEKFYPVTHVDAVIGLKDSSFFEKVQDGLDPTKYSVKLKSEYTGLWADGWIAAGGVGSGSGGGGGGSSFLNDLLDVTAPNPAQNDLLRWNGSAWVNVPQSQISPAISFSDLTSHPDSLSGYGINDAYTKTQVDALLSNIDLSEYGTSLSLGSVATYLKDANGKFVVDSSGRYIITAGASTSINLVNGSGTVISSVTLPSASASELLSLYVPTSRTINGHSLESDITLSAVSDLGVAQWAMGGEGDKIPFSILPDLYAIGTKVTDTAAKGTLLGIEAISNDLSSTGSENSLIKWENGAWHVFGNLYADGWIAAGGIGNGSGSGGGGSVTSVAMTVPTGLSVSGTPITSSGTLAVSLASGYVIPRQSTLDNFVTLDGTQTITGAKTFTNTVTIGQTGSLSFHQSSHIDLGPIRFEYDPDTDALHITTNDPTNHPTISLYADGFVAAGGVGQTT